MLIARTQHTHASKHTHTHTHAYKMQWRELSSLVGYFFVLFLLFE